MKRGKKHIVWIPIFLLLLLLMGCGANGILDENASVADGTADNITPIDDNLIVVGVSQIGSESVWRTANSMSIQKTFTKENGYFLIFDNARQKQENQIKAIRSFISQQVDYIVFSPITETGWDTVLQEAKDAGIPVILMDRRIETTDQSLFTAWVGSDFEEEGKKAGRWLEEYLESINLQEKEMNIVVLKGTEGATSVIGRTNGFDTIAKNHSNWNILEECDAEYTTTKGYEVMKDLLEKYPEINVVVSQNDDMTFGAYNAIREVGKKTGVNGDIILISFDAVKTALKMVENDQINVDIECNPSQGSYIEKIIQKLENGEEISKYNYIDEQIFSIKNVGEYIDSRTY